MTELFAIEPPPPDLLDDIYGDGGPHKVIRASAGSGKTYQLTARYLRLLRHHAAPETILATTFTRKAAGEILARVLGRLAQAARDADERKKLSKALQGDPLTGAQCMAMLSRLVGSLDRLSISTIDSFFNRIAQGFRYELDLPPGRLEMVDEKHPLAAQLRARAIEALLGDDDLATMLTLLRRLHHNTADRSVTQAIDDIVCHHYEAYRQAPDEALWTKLKPPGLLDEGEVNDAVAALAAMESSLPTTRTGKPRSAWAKGLARDVAAAHARNWDAFLGGGVPAKLAAGESTFDSTPIEGAWLATYQVLVRHALAVQIQTIAMQTQATHNLLQRFHQHYETLRRRHRLLLFSDLTHKLARLLPSLGDQVLADVYYRLDGRVTHLLLDEFQDTSVDQWKVLQPIAEEVASHSDGSRSFFCVGDVKQAIYGWRGGCADLFDHAEMLAGGSEGLSTSWRSSQVVLDAVNQVFGGIGGNVALDNDQQAAQRWQDAFEPHVAARELPGHVELVTSIPDAARPHPTGDDDDEETFGSHEEFAARRIAAIHRAAPGKSIGVLVATNAMVKLMLHELRCLGLPVSGEGGNPVTDSPAVSAVMAAMTLADHPGHTAAAFHVLNSPIGDVVGLRSLQPAETARVAVAIRRSLLTRGYADTLSQWMAALAPSCDERSLVRLGQLVELAEQYEPMETLRPGRFVAFVEATPVEEPSPAPIRVMTIHASKGLEFDAVVLPQLDRQLKSNPALLVQRDEPTGPIRGVYRCPATSIRERMPQVQHAYEAYQQAERQEDLCSLYVAMTRAVHALHMIVRPLSRKKDGKPGTRGWTNLSFATMLRRSLSEVEEGFDGDEVLYRRGNKAWAGDAQPAGSAKPKVTASTLRVTLAEADAESRRGWASVTPSSLHGGGRVRAGDLLRLDDGEGVVVGRVIHRWLEMVGFLDEDGLPDDQTLRQAAAEEGLDRAAADDLIQRMRQMLDQPVIRSVLCRGGASELWRERSFAVHTEGRLLHGQFDRVAVFRQPAGGDVQRAMLIDFKTDRVSDDALDARFNHYRPQLAAYRGALAQMLRLDVSRIETKALFLHTGAVRTL